MRVLYYVHISISEVCEDERLRVNNLSFYVSSMCYIVEYSGLWCWSQTGLILPVTVIQQPVGLSEPLAPTPPTEWFPLHGLLHEIRLGATKTVACLHLWTSVFNLLMQSGLPRYLGVRLFRALSWSRCRVLVCCHVTFLCTVFYTLVLCRGLTDRNGGLLSTDGPVPAKRTGLLRQTDTSRPDSPDPAYPHFCHHLLPPSSAAIFCRHLLPTLFQNNFKADWIDYSAIRMPTETRPPRPLDEPIVICTVWLTLQWTNDPHDWRVDPFQFIDAIRTQRLWFLSVFFFNSTGALGHRIYLTS